MKLTELIKLADAVYSPTKDDWELKQALLHFDRAADPATVKRMAELLVQCREALEFECGNRCNAEYNPCNARDMIAALDEFDGEEK